MWDWYTSSSRKPHCTSCTRNWLAVLTQDGTGLFGGQSAYDSGKCHQLTWLPFLSYDADLEYTSGTLLCSLGALTLPTAAFETAWFLLLCTSQLLIFNSWLRSEVSYMFQRPGGLWAIVSYRFVPWVPGPINRVALDSGLGIYLLPVFPPIYPLL